MTPSSNFIHSGRSRSHLPSCDPAARTKTAEEVRGDSWGGRWPGQDCGLAPQSIFCSRDKVALDNELSYYVIRRGIWPWHEIQIKIIKLIFRGRERRRRLLGASEIICTAFKYFNSLPSSEISNLRIWVIQQVQNIRTAVHCQSVSWFTVTLKRALKIHHYRLVKYFACYLVPASSFIFNVNNGSKESSPSYFYFCQIFIPSLEIW